jgi:hypothetical protein
MRQSGKGSKLWAPRPYIYNSLVNDFDIVRKLAFGPSERRQLADMRRSGAVEGVVRPCPDATRGRLCGTPPRRLSLLLCPQAR